MSFSPNMFGQTEYMFFKHESCLLVAPLSSTLRQQYIISIDSFYNLYIQSHRQSYQNRLAGMPTARLTRMCGSVAGCMSCDQKTRVQVPTWPTLLRR